MGWRFLWDAYAVPHAKPHTLPHARPPRHLPFTCPKRTRPTAAHYPYRDTTPWHAAHTLHHTTHPTNLPTLPFLHHFVSACLQSRSRRAHAPGLLFLGAICRLLGCYLLVSRRARSCASGAAKARGWHQKKKKKNGDAARRTTRLAAKMANTVPYAHTTASLLNSSCGVNSSYTSLSRNHGTLWRLLSIRYAMQRGHKPLPSSGSGFGDIYSNATVQGA